MFQSLLWFELDSIEQQQECLCYLFMREFDQLITHCIVISKVTDQAIGYVLCCICVCVVFGYGYHDSLDFQLLLAHA